MASMQSVSEAQRRVCVGIFARQGDRDELGSILQEVGADLAAGPGELVQRGEIDIAR